VADQIGVAIPNANVVLISEKTKEKYTTTSTLAIQAA
jgi:hypothetical protein